MIGYIDSEFAGSKSGRKSTGRYIFILTGAAISHSPKGQSIVALSACEAKYVTMCEAAKEAVWSRSLLAELVFRKEAAPVTLYADNQGSIALANNPEFYQGTKYIDDDFTRFVKPYRCASSKSTVFPPRK